jgi:hypothetical protein
LEENEEIKEALAGGAPPSTKKSDLAVISSLHQRQHN